MKIDSLHEKMLIFTEFVILDIHIAIGFWNTISQYTNAEIC
jgi:hypothetical protein